MTTTEICFFLVAVRGTNARDVLSQIGDITDFSAEEEGMVDTLLPPVVLITYGFLPEQSDLRSWDERFATALRERFGDQIKSLHAIAELPYGNVGSDARYSFTIVHPNMLALMAELERLDYGIIKRIAEQTGELYA